MPKMLRDMLLLPVLFWVGAAAAVPAHYIVFEFDAQGQAQPVFHALVEIAADDSQPGPVSLFASDSQVERIAWRPLRDGVAGEDRIVEVPRVLRAEFAFDPDRGDHRIEHHRHVPAGPRSFVLRVPVAEADEIELVGERSFQHFDLSAIAAAAANLPLAGVAPAQVTGSRGDDVGNAANRVDVLVLGDGYTHDQQAVFAAHADTLHSAMFSVSPHGEYANFVNWMTGFVASQQAGADHPPYQAGCTTASCCADPDAMTDPLAGTFVDTAFDATFCTFQIQRLLTANSSKVYAAAAGYPDWDFIVVTVNDPTYGGSGGAISVLSAHSFAPLVVIHEHGHTFTHLADEYDTPYPGFPPCSDLGPVPNCEANVTDQTIGDLVKWRYWYEPSDIPVPTPPGTPGTGLFEGARYLSTGMYRPVHSACLMRQLGTAFCNVCRQQYVKRLYAGGWGVPSGGIDLIEPGTESPPHTATVLYAAGSDRTFRVQVLHPDVGNIAMVWLLDGAAILGADDESFVFRQSTAEPATRTLELRVIDQTSFVHRDMADGLMTHSRTWTIQVIDDVLFANGFELE